MIHESDIAEERWAREAWKHFELWEKIETRQKRKRRWLVAGAIGCFLLVSAIPVCIENLPRWRALHASRLLAREVSALTRDAAKDGKARRLRLVDSGKFLLETGESCDSQSWAPVRELQAGSAAIQVMGPDLAVGRGIPGVLSGCCYDPRKGFDTGLPGLGAFALIPSGDLTAVRVDRIALVLIAPESQALEFASASDAVAELREAAAK